MSNDANNPTLFRLTYLTLLACPWHFFWLQLPAASFEPTEKILYAVMGNHPLWQMVLTVPYYFIVALISTAATFVLVVTVEENRILTIKEIKDQILKKIRPIILGALILGPIIALGLMAFVLPGIYLTSVYLFVPHSIMSEDGLSITEYFHRSSTLARTALWKTVGVVFVVFLAGPGIYIVGERLGGAIASAIIPFAFLQIIVIILFKMVISMAIGAVVDVFICQYFFQLKRLAHEKARTTT